MWFRNELYSLAEVSLYCIIWKFKSEIKGSLMKWYETSPHQMQHLQWQFRYKWKRVYGGTLNSVCQPSSKFTASSLQIRFTRRPTTALPCWRPVSCDFYEFKIKAGRFGILREFAGIGSFKGHVQEQYSRDDIKRQVREENYEIGRASCRERV